MDGRCGLAEGTAQIICTGDIRKPGCGGGEFRIFGTVGLGLRPHANLRVKCVRCGCEYQIGTLNGEG